MVINSPRRVYKRSVIHHWLFDEGGWRLAPYPPYASLARYQVLLGNTCLPSSAWPRTLEAELADTTKLCLVASNIYGVA
jgi:hypothetical protein